MEVTSYEKNYRICGIRFTVIVIDCCFCRYSISEVDRRRRGIRSNNCYPYTGTSSKANTSADTETNTGASSKANTNTGSDSGSKANTNAGTNTEASYNSSSCTWYLS